MSEITRTEKFLRACIDGEPCALKPLTRVEKLLAELNDKLAGGPSEVVILPETEVAAISESPITTAPNAMPEVGAVCTVTYNGTAYDCPAVAAAITAEVTGVAFGNTDALGIPGGNTNAPFMVVLLETPMDMEGVPVYGMLLPQGGTAEGTYVTLSIVQEGAASGGESAGGGYLYFTGTATMNSDTNNGEATLDKSFAEVLAAIKGKKPVFCALSGVNDGTIYILQAVSSWNDVIVSLSGTMTGTRVELTMTKDGTNTVLLR